MCLPKPLDKRRLIAQVRWSPVVHHADAVDVVLRDNFTEQRQHEILRLTMRI